MGEIAEEIAAVIAIRRQCLPQVRAEITQWRRADAALAALEHVAGQLCGHPAAPPGLTAKLEHLRIAAVRPSITGAIELVQRLEARIQRGTVNIAITGAVGVGKSTVLRSISGLADTELPTGSDTPATAVPIRLHHTSGRRRAVLALHTFDSFRATHLQPRYARAGLGESPTDVEAFRASVYREPDPTDPADAIRELRTMQAALWSYEGLLDRPSRVLELSGDDVDRLRDYVTYPGSAQGREDRPALRYLGVRDATIERSFPHEHHRAFTLVDLPGQRPGSVEVAQRYFARLRYDVDVMLLIRPAGDAPPAHGDGDGATPSPLQPVCARAGRLTGFVLPVVNARTKSGRVLEVGALEVDATDPDDVSTRLLRPVLRHLAGRLPGLDAGLDADIRALTRPVRDQLIGLAASIKAIASQLPAMTPGTANELYRRVDVLRTRLADALRRLQRSLVEQSPRERRRLRAAVADVHTELVRWLEDGLGRGRDRWYAEALRAMTRDGVARFSSQELVRVRVEIHNRYDALDGHLGRRLDELWSGLADVLSREFGALLDDRSGAAALARLAELARGATEPCPGLISSIDTILAARLDYRTHLRPRVSTELRALVDKLPAVPATRSGVEQLYRSIRRRADVVAARTRVRLLREAGLPEQVLGAAMAQFNDGVLAGADGEREIRQLARAYRHDLWPDLAEDLDGADARVAAVVRAADELLDVTTGLAGPRS